VAGPLWLGTNIRAVLAKFYSWTTIIGQLRLGSRGWVELDGLLWLGRWGKDIWLGYYYLSAVAFGHLCLYSHYWATMAGQLWLGSCGWADGAWQLLLGIRGWAVVIEQL
jgi:hypothetical protein